MRIYNARFGKYPGEYEIFDNIEEFHNRYPERTILRWARDPIEDHLKLNAGEWVEAEDGLIAVCLNKYEVGERGSFRFRFPMSTIRVYYTKSKGWKIQQFYAMYTTPSKKAAEEYISIFKSLDDRELKSFVALLVGGADPLKAMKAAFATAESKGKRGGNRPSENAWHKLVELLSYKKIRVLIMEALTQFGTELNQKFPAETLITDLKALYDSTTNDRLKFDMIKFISEQQGFTKKLTAGGRQAKGNNGTEEAVFTEERYPEVEG